MSESENKPGAPAGNKRRRRRRRPAGEGGSKGSSGEGQPPRKSGSGEGQPQVKSRSGESSGSGSRAKRSRGGRSRGGKGESSQRKPAASPRAAPSAPVRREVPLVDQEAPAVAEAPTIRWGDDSDAPTPDINLSADLPTDASTSDWDPESAGLLGYDGQLSARICNVIGVRFIATGRMYLYDAGDGHYDAGDSVVVEGDRGQRTAIVTAASCRRPPPRSLKRILRRGSVDEGSETGAQTESKLQDYLGTAKAKAKELSLGIKVFRASFEDDREKLAIYYSCEDKTDVRPLTRALSDALPLRVELRHTGVRDEAKLVGGIGACGLELCCTTWLPSFAPVSIKHAKDQGLALTPSKITGQCGRLKCCLVYEQENYAKLRKGLPKLGKRVITNDGFEGRVIELDVLHQRIRVSVGRGESKVYKKGEVEPMFASQPQGVSSKKNEEEPNNESK